MATQLQLRKGTKIQNDAFTGAEAELTYDTTSKGLRIHDGNTQGGNEIPVLVAVQRPTAENNYTWYRKYSDGWVEQGGIITNPAETYYTLPVEMADTNYTVFITDRTQSKVSSNAGTPTSTTQFYLSTNGTGSAYSKSWEVKGMAA